MKTIILQNVVQQEIAVFQKALFDHYNFRDNTFKKSSDFLAAIMEMDIMLRLWYSFRSRIEKIAPNKGYRITLKPSEAAALFIALNAIKFKGEATDNYIKNVKVKFTSIIDQQLKSL